MHTILATRVCFLACTLGRRHAVVDKHHARGMRLLFVRRSLHHLHDGLRAFDRNIIECSQCFRKGRSKLLFGIFMLVERLRVLKQELRVLDANSTGVHNRRHCVKRRHCFRVALPRFRPIRESAGRISMKWLIAPMKRARRQGWLACGT